MLLLLLLLLLLLMLMMLMLMMVMMAVAFNHHHSIAGSGWQCIIQQSICPAFRPGADGAGASNTVFFHR
jgi:hypothetical protein